MFFMNNAAAPQRMTHMAIFRSLYRAKAESLALSLVRARQIEGAFYFYALRAAEAIILDGGYWLDSSNNGRGEDAMREYEKLQRMGYTDLAVDCGIAADLLRAAGRRDKAAAAVAGQALIARHGADSSVVKTARGVWVRDAKKEGLVRKVIVNQKAA